MCKQIFVVVVAWNEYARWRDQDFHFNLTMMIIIIRLFVYLPRINEFLTHVVALLLLLLAK